MVGGRVMMKVCSGCWRAFPVHELRGSRCARCAKTHERDKSRRRRRTAKERQRRQALIKQHVQAYGWVCPGHGRPAHEAHDLTADHVLPVARGGSETGEIRVLCRSCNSARGARLEHVRDRTRASSDSDGRRGRGSTRVASSNHPVLVIREKQRNPMATRETNSDDELLVG
jgi:5-methylcytosine-specific restriction endonuclease McrA